MSLPKVATATLKVLSDIELFSRYVLKTPLYAYQLDPARAVMDSISNSRGDEILHPDDVLFLRGSPDGIARLRNDSSANDKQR